MPIVGFNFDKISVEKNNPIKGKVTVSSDIKLSSVEESKLSIDKPCLKISFEFSVKYDPDVGNVALRGHIFYLESPDKIKSIVKDWKSSKKLPETVSLESLNMILNKCNIESLILSEKINLPPQLPLGRFTPKKQEPKVAK